MGSQVGIGVLLFVGLCPIVLFDAFGGNGMLVILRILKELFQN
jgi:hypothetical protein